MIAMMSFIDGRPLFYRAGADAEGVDATSLSARPQAALRYVYKLCQMLHFTAKGIRSFRADWAALLAP
jgi:hypothetical protein